ncbi:DUF5689 domain-containing protein [Chitinophaga sp. Cy-1792]|uniref:DUF5689 domain-containing protein n=1 Tax=Chitinophaga sp. Cy-1792 TaxID=2608339 RepID=UPI00141E8421|nr:DUF5689 domain-containing protein [Chitinophaga sp. Cy-1792]NIG56485.1 hypothetical protein [Chitinophaga sp. Cy-1792]
MKRFYIPALLLAVMPFMGCLKKDTNYAHGTLSPLASIEVLRSVYKGQDIQVSTDNLSGAYQIAGVVVSDNRGNNLPAGTFALQNYGRGKMRGIFISLGENAAVKYTAGDSLIVNVDGATLRNFQGALQLVNVNADKIQLIKQNIKPAMRSISMSELSKNFSSYEATLVQLDGGFQWRPAATDVYSGMKAITDGIDSTLFLRTLGTAVFAGEKIPASASFTGIPMYYNSKANVTDSTTSKTFALRTIADVSNQSGPLYNTFPEDFENPPAASKGSYAAADVTLKTGLWRLDQAILGDTKDRDRFNPAGKQCIRMQQNLTTSAYVMMKFDLPNGASKVTLSYGSYFTDASSSWTLESSIDQGTTWQRVGDTIRNAGPVAQKATFLMDLQQPVRFRINKLGLGATNGTNILNGRLSIDDIAVYEKLNH